MRSLHHLGRSSEAKNRKNTKKVKSDGRTGALWAKMCSRLRIEGLPYLYSFHIAHKYTYVSNNIFLHIFKHCMLFSHKSDSFLLILKAYKLIIQERNIEENPIEITFLLF